LQREKKNWGLRGEGPLGFRVSEKRGRGLPPRVSAGGGRISIERRMGGRKGVFGGAPRKKRGMGGVCREGECRQKQREKIIYNEKTKKKTRLFRGKEKKKIPRLPSVPRIRI